MNFLLVLAKIQLFDRTFCKKFKIDRFFKGLSLSLHMDSHNLSDSDDLGLDNAPDLFSNIHDNPYLSDSSDDKFPEERDNDSENDRDIEEDIEDDGYISSDDNASENASDENENASDNENVDENASDEDPLSALELKKRMLHLALEINMIEKQFPLIDKSNQQKIDHTDAETNFTNERTKHLKLTNKKDSVLGQLEIANAEAHMPLIKELVEKRQAGDLIRLDQAITDLKDPRARKRKDLEIDNELSVLSGQNPFLKEHAELAHRCQIARLQNDLADESYRTKRLKKVEAIETLHFDLVKRDLKEEWNEWTNEAVQYLADPVRVDPKTGQVELVMSDRVINLEGPICYATAHYISDCINYYNNQNASHPIFIVINYSPGGSVMAGFQIMKAIETSQAPIYVLVEGFAASMAAVIASMADRSFILPNAEILHHQVWSSAPDALNVAKAKEFSDDLMKCYRRLTDPFLVKIGMTYDDWMKQMYQHNLEGDWSVYGDESVRLGWVDQVVHTIRKTGKTRHPFWWLKQMYGISLQASNTKAISTSPAVSTNFQFPSPGGSSLGFSSSSANPSNSSSSTSSPTPFGSQLSSFGSQLSSPFGVSQVSPPSFNFPAFQCNSSVPISQLAEMNLLANADQRVLPPLRPRDHYMIYNRNNYYSIPK